MRSGLEQSPQVSIYRQYVQVLGLRYDVTNLGPVTFPGYAGSLSLLNAQSAP